MANRAVPIRVDYSELHAAVGFRFFTYIANNYAPFSGNYCVIDFMSAEKSAVDCAFHVATKEVQRSFSTDAVCKDFPRESRLGEVLR
jgi:hypothetical protein